MSNMSKIETTCRKRAVQLLCLTINKCYGVGVEVFMESKKKILGMFDVGKVRGANFRWLAPHSPWPLLAALVLFKV